MISKQITNYRCPECSSTFESKESCFPFCSERCKLIDLGAWAAEAYKIPDTSQLPEESALEIESNHRNTESQN